MTGQPASAASRYVVLDTCTACGACLLTCPEHAIVASVPLVVREDRCTGCGECVEICPADAVLEVRTARPPGAAPGAATPRTAGRASAHLPPEAGR